MKATKGNKVYSIDENQKQFYLDSGFDVLGEDGQVIGYGRGKTVSYEKYTALASELEAVKASGTAGSDDELVKLRKEYEQLKADAEAVLPVLSAYCLEHEIDLGKANTLSGMLKKIKEASAGEQ